MNLVIVMVLENREGPGDGDAQTGPDWGPHAGPASAAPARPSQRICTIAPQLTAGAALEKATQSKVDFDHK